MSNDKDQIWVIKYKSLNWSDEMIAGKLGIPEKRVKEIWDALCRQVAEQSSNGYIDLLRYLEVVTCHYKNLGESLGVLGAVLSRGISPDKLREMVGEQAAEKLKGFIVLEAFTPPPLTPIKTAPPKNN